MCSSARATSADASDAIASSNRPPAALTKSRRSRATWSLRLRPVWSLPPSGPSFSCNRFSTAMWMSSAAATLPSPAASSGANAVPRVHVDRPVEQGGGPGPAPLGLGRLDEGVEPLLQRAEPGAVIDEVSPLLIDERLEVELLLGEAELLQVVMQLEEDRGRGRLVELARFQAHDAVLEDVDLPDSMTPGDHVELRDDFWQRAFGPVERDRHAMLEGDGNLRRR